MNGVKNPYDLWMWFYLGTWENPYGKKTRQLWVFFCMTSNVEFGNLWNWMDENEHSVNVLLNVSHIPSSHVGGPCMRLWFLHLFAWTAPLGNPGPDPAGLVVPQGVLTCRATRDAKTTGKASCIFDPIWL